MMTEASVNSILLETKLVLDRFEPKSNGCLNEDLQQLHADYDYGVSCRASEWLTVVCTLKKDKYVN